MTEEAAADSAAPVGRATRRVAVVCESTACLPEDLRARYGIGTVPIPFVFGEQTYRDGVDLTPAEFYARLVATRAVPKTSPPSPGEYLAAWQAAAAPGMDVLAVTVDSKVSTLQRSTLLARDLAPEMLPGVAVAVVDSLSAGMGQGFVALDAARAAARGGDLATVVAVAERRSHAVRLVVMLDTLEYLAKTSRIPQVAAFFGGILDIKPIIQISGGDIHPIARVRTRRRAIEALLEQLRHDAVPGALLHAAVQHAYAAEAAALIEARVRTAYDCAELYTTEFTPVMGGYCGPGLLGIAYYFEPADDA